MPSPIIVDPTPSWLKPENASVTDSALTRAMRMIGHLIGADNPTSQVLGLMMSDIPSGPTGGISGAIERLIERGKAIKAYHGSPHDEQINQGTRNYVVFDDKLIDILKKYGLIGPAVALSAEGRQR